ncbi:hypothetical protein ABZ915_10655 [Streptomyces sp. NPDC046915]|uniref:hypothetical protein n=1 Tax=Streptomyces sp. NPDC046915 TaxID=3155257 RepID=UPI0033F2E299
MNVRLLALAGVVACAVALPLTVASAGQVGDARRAAVRTSERADAAAPGVDGAAPGADARVPGADAKDPSTVPTPTPLLLGLGLATAARCGPELTSPAGVEGQTCVMTQSAETWARTYYRNATGEALDAVLSFMGPGGRTVQMRCAVGADDEPGTCETPRERSRGVPDAYTAVTEFAARGADGPLLLRSGSNSEVPTGS